MRKPTRGCAPGVKTEAIFWDALGSPRQLHRNKPQPTGCPSQSYCQAIANRLCPATLAWALRHARSVAQGSHPGGKGLEVLPRTWR